MPLPLPLLPPLLLPPPLLPLLLPLLPLSFPAAAEHLSLQTMRSSPLPGNGGGGGGGSPGGEVLLVSKTLTFSDVATDVARSGRIVLPRVQVQACLACSGPAAPATRLAAPPSRGRRSASLSRW